MLFFWKQNSPCIFSNEKSERHFCNYIQQQKGSDVMEVRKIHPKLYHISLWRLISTTMPFLGSSEDVQPLFGTGQQVWLQGHSEHKLLGSLSCALPWPGDRALSKALAPFHQLSQGPSYHPPGALQIRVGVARSLILGSWLSFDFLKLRTSMFSFHCLSYSVLPGDTNCKLQCTHSGELMSVLVPLSTFNIDSEFSTE